MQTNYQVFYRDNQRIEKINLQGINKDMAVKFFALLRPDVEVVHVTDDPTPMTTQYVENLIEANLLKQ